jgi:hypothetical protein
MDAALLRQALENLERSKQRVKRNGRRSFEGARL